MNKLISFFSNCLLASVVCADPVTVPNTFSAGTPAKASEVNANFTALANAVNDAPRPLMVKDSNGKIVGTYVQPYAFSSGTLNSGMRTFVYTDSVFIRTSTISFVLGFTANLMGYNNAQDYYDIHLFYETTDCTGSIYLRTSDYGQSEAPMYRGIVSYNDQYPASKNIVYIGDRVQTGFGPYNGRAIKSSSYGDPHACVPVYLSGEFNKVIDTYDLSLLGLVPPFTVY